jgi:hypothetical protein
MSRASLKDSFLCLSRFNSEAAHDAENLLLLPLPSDPMLELLPGASLEAWATSQTTVAKAGPMNTGTSTLKGGLTAKLGALARSGPPRFVSLTSATARRTRMTAH